MKMVLRNMAADPWYDPAELPDRQYKTLSLMGRVGGFRGFGGEFLNPPRAATGSDGQIYLFDSDAAFVLHADRFGATLHRAGKVRRNGAVRKFPQLAGSTSFAATDHTLAVCLDFGQAPGCDPESQPVDLYLGIDCSGSMPNPRYQLSFPVLAGTIMALSALRAGARVMVALSGEPGEFSETDGFIRSEADLLKVLTGYLGTGFAFGISRLKATFLSGKVAVERKTHILMITDSDIFSMLGQHSGWEIAEQALQKAGGGGTYVLHKVDTDRSEVVRMQEQGWSVYGLTEWESLIRFAQEFSRKRYGDGKNEKRTPAP